MQTWTQLKHSRAARAATLPTISPVNANPSTQGPTSEPITVVAAYRFVEIDDCEALRQRLFGSAAAAGLKGTVLIANEGINLSMAGPHIELERWLSALQSDPRFTSVELKQHRTALMPFKRLRVKVKAEIIRMNQPTVRPQAGRAPAVTASTLARWLQSGRCDEGREVVMLDTRNGFEVDAGTFENAIDWRLRKFSEFPAALEANRAELEGKTVVSYCTGGIRCEKAALWMEHIGLRNVLQLDGGILRYFEEAPGAPGWRGDCFVFDEREGLDAALHEQHP